MKAIMLLAAANLAYQEACVYDHSSDDQGEKDDAEKQQHTFAPVKDDPSNIQRDRQRYQANAQAEKENDSSAATRDAHSLILQAQSESSPHRIRRIAG